MSSEIDKSMQFLDDVVTSLKTQLRENEENIVLWQNIQELTEKANVEIQNNLPVVGADEYYATRLRRLSGSLKTVITSTAQSMSAPKTLVASQASMVDRLKDKGMS